MRARELALLPRFALTEQLAHAAQHVHVRDAGRGRHLHRRLRARRRFELAQPAIERGGLCAPVDRRDNRRAGGCTPAAATSPAAVPAGADDEAVVAAIAHFDIGDRGCQPHDEDRRGGEPPGRRDAETRRRRRGRGATHDSESEIRLRGRPRRDLSARRAQTRQLLTAVSAGGQMGLERPPVGGVDSP